MALHEKLQKWMQEGTAGPLIYDSKAIVDNLSDRIYSDYEPTRGPYLGFQDRLEDWIEGNGLNDENQRILYSLIRYLFFVGSKEFDTLFRVAFNEHIITWLIDEVDVKIDNDKITSQLKLALKETWFCSISDSLKISMFYHINGISGHKYRPDWSSLEKFGDKESILKYIKTSKVKRIVLLEDFVGSGTQMSPVVKFAASLKNTIPVLVVPFIICPKGLEVAAELIKEYKNLKISPIIKLSQSLFLTEKPLKQEDEFFPQLRKLVVDLEGKIFQPPDSKLPGETPFGFKSIGAFIIMYTNCPNNSLPIIHKATQGWNALFPRAVRD